MFDVTSAAPQLRALTFMSLAAAALSIGLALAAPAHAAMSNPSPGGSNQSTSKDHGRGHGGDHAGTFAFKPKKTRSQCLADAVQEWTDCTYGCESRYSGKTRASRSRLQSCYEFCDVVLAGDKDTCNTIQ